MAASLKQYADSKGTDAALNADFAEATRYRNVKPGKQAVFWKSVLRWCKLPVSEIQRIFRRVEPVYGKLC